MRLSLVVLIALFFLVQIGGLVWYFQEELRESSAGLVENGLVTPAEEAQPRVAMPGGPITEADNPKLGHELLRGRVLAPEGVLPGSIEVIADQRPIAPEQVLNSHHRRPRWRTNLEADGSFHFAHLEPGSYVVTARSRDFHGASLVHLEAQRVHPEMLVTLTKARPLRGRVFDAAGTSIARALVYPLPAAPDDEQPATWTYAWHPAESDLSGYFNFQHLPDMPIRFLVVHTQFATHLTPPIEDAAKNLEIRLDAGLDASLVLQNPRGNITRTKVRLTELEFGLESHAGHTGPGGVVAFSKLRPAHYRVTVESDRYALADGAFEWHVESGATGPRAVEIIRGGTIRGQVLAQQTKVGIKDVLVEVHGPQGPDRLSVHTDRGGYYRFAGLTPGAYRVMVRPSPAWLIEGPGEAEVEVVRNDRSQGPAFILKPGIPVSGVVSTPDGMAVAHAEVFLNLSQENRIDRAIRSNAQGAFSFEGIPEGATVRIWAQSEGQLSPVFGPTTPGPEGLPQISLTIEHSASAHIRGEVLDPTGAPMAGALLRLDASEKILPIPLETRSDAWGAFQFAGLAPGDYRVSLGEPEENGEEPVTESLTLTDGETMIITLQAP